MKHNKRITSQRHDAISREAAKLDAEMSIKQPLFAPQQNIDTKQMRFEIVTITPQMAEAWLKTSNGNPRWQNKLVDTRRVNAIVRDIVAGKWNPGNNSIAFDTNGNLIDGHHRLTAIVVANMPVQTCVCYGVSDEGKKHIDDVAKRTQAQILGANRKIIAMANIHIKFLYGSNAVSSTENINDFFAQYSETLERISTISAINHNAITLRSYCYHAIFCAAACGVKIDDLQTFANVLNSGFADGDNQSAAIALRNQLIKHKIYSVSERIQGSRNTQSAIYDFINDKPRRNPYQAKTAYYTDQMISEEK